MVSRSISIIIPGTCIVLRKTPSHWFKMPHCALCTALDANDTRDRTASAVGRFLLHCSRILACRGMSGYIADNTVFFRMGYFWRPLHLWKRARAQTREKTLDLGGSLASTLEFFISGDS